VVDQHSQHPAPRDVDVFLPTVPQRLLILAPGILESVRKKREQRESLLFLDLEGQPSQFGRDGPGTSRPSVNSPPVTSRSQVQRYTSAISRANSLSLSVRRSRIVVSARVGADLGELYRNSIALWMASLRSWPVHCLARKRRITRTMFSLCRWFAERETHARDRQAARQKQSS
jgi:hypothetical protein